MAHLSLSLLGSFQVTLAEESVTAFESDKVRALLAYLAVEADQPHRRDSLVGLLWPDWPDRAARTNLRNALANLRGVISDRHAAPPFLLITRETIQFNTASDAWFDVRAFTKLLEATASPQQTIRQLEEAVALYRGNFLEGFYVKGSAAFEDWCSLMRERLQRQALTALHRLAGYYEQRGEYERACEVAWRQVELEPWEEEAHRQLMRMLTFSGQRSAALTQYETCRRLLDEELGIEPTEETTKLYQQIRDGELSRGAREQRDRGDFVAVPPAFLTSAPQPPSPPAPFVAREHELAQLGGFLDLALAGQGRAVFVTGDVEAKWAAGAITRDHAHRLWNMLPLTAQALVEAGPDLIDTFIPGTPLIERALAYAPGGADWLARLDELVKRKAIPAAPGPQQSALFEQYAKVLQTLARQTPLVLVLDDLQWADLGSISLLFHLGRQLAGSRILIVGAYRSEEVALGRDGERHPLEPVVHEFQREFGDIAVNVDEAASRDFVEAFVDNEPNRLGLPFREKLYRQTRGHALFAIELVRGLQERGDLVQDEEGRWVEGPALDWETLPPRVEGVIAERIGRLTDPLQEALRAASVEGETFTAEVVAQVQAAGEREMVACLSDELDRRHRLVSAQGILRIDDQHLSQYRFRHILFQKYLYDSLDQVKRARLHEAIGRDLEALYGQQTEEIAVQLARHFREAGMAKQAIPYLHQAGNKAVRLSANEEAVAHFTQALELLETLPDIPERTQQELELQLGLAVPLLATRGYAAPEVGRAYDRARKLCQQIGETPQLFPALMLLWTYYIARAQYQTALELGEQILSLAERAEDLLQIAVANWTPGLSLLYLGEFERALAHLEQMIAFYDPQQHRSLAFVYGQDPGVSCLSWAAWALWFLGYPDRALKWSHEAVALAQDLDHAFTLGFALGMAGALFHQFRREDQTAQERNEAMMKLSTEEGFPLVQVLGTTFQGWTQAMAGQVETGIAQMRQGLATWQAMGTGMHRSHLLALLAEAYGKAGQAEEGLEVLAEALGVVEKNGERYYEAELHRSKGELLLMQEDQTQAEVSFHQAIEVARRQQAKSWELRAAMSLSRLWQRQGKREEAHHLLAGVYDWFTEGFDTPDLKEAKALLEELS